MTLSEKFIDILSRAKGNVGVCEFESAIDDLQEYLVKNPNVSVAEVELIEKMCEFLDEERVRVFNDDDEVEDDEEFEREEDEFNHESLMFSDSDYDDEAWS